MKNFLFVFNLITIAFTSQAYAGAEVVTTLDSSSGQWRVMRYADQGRCAVQSPRIDGTIMIINVKKADPGQLFFTFMNPEETMWASSKGKPDGYIAVFQEPDDLIIEEILAGKANLFRTPVWENSYKKDGIGVYYQEMDGKLFTTVVPNRFQGIDPNTGKPINFLDILTSDEYRRYYNWNIAFSNSDNLKSSGTVDYEIRIDQVPDLTPFLNCLQ